MEQDFLEFYEFAVDFKVWFNSIAHKFEDDWIRVVFDTADKSVFDLIR